MAGRLLIAAGEAASAAQDLPFGVRVLLDAAEEILVVAPELPGRFEWLASATDKSRRQADERLRTVLRRLRDDPAVDAGVAGAVGSDDPLLAFEDAVREFAPDHILVGLRGGDRAGWQESGLLDELIRRFAVPVTVFEL